MMPNTTLHRTPEALDLSSEVKLSKFNLKYDRNVCFYWQSVLR